MVFIKIPILQEAIIYCESMAQQINRSLQIDYKNESFVITDENDTELIRVNSLEHLRIATFYFVQGTKYFSK